MSFGALSSSEAVVLNVPREQNLTYRALDKRFNNARLSFFNPGQGTCGVVSEPSDFIVALNADVRAPVGTIQYDSTLCFEEITITAEGKTTTAQIVDECPECPFGGLALSPGLFTFFAPLSDGVITGSWNFDTSS